MKTYNVLIVLFIIAVVILVGLPLFLAQEDKNHLVIKGSTTVYPLIQHCVDHFLEEHPEACITVSAEGSGSGIAALLDNNADIAMSSRPLRTEEQQFIINKGLDIAQYHIGEDGIAIIVHPKNDIVGLSLAELRAIYTGGITDWSDIGGSSGMIVPISRDITSGTYVVFRDQVLQTKDAATSVQLVPSNDTMVLAVAGNQKAIGYIGLSYITDKVKALPIDGIHPEPKNVATGEYPLSRALFLFAPKESFALRDAFLGFVLSVEGKRIITDDYIISLQ